jgi:hypothetical protein
MSLLLYRGVRSKTLGFFDEQARLLIRLEDATVTAVSSPAPVGYTNRLTGVYRDEEE